MSLQIVFHLETDRTARIYTEYNQSKDEYRILAVTGGRVVADLMRHTQQTGYIDSLAIPSLTSPYWSMLRDGNSLDDYQFALLEEKFQPLMSLLSIELIQYIHQKRSPVCEINLTMVGSRARIWADTARWIQPLLKREQGLPPEIHESSSPKTHPTSPR